MIAQDPKRARNGRNDNPAPPQSDHPKAGWDGEAEVFGETHSNTNGFWSSIGTTLAQNHGARCSETQSLP